MIDEEFQISPEDSIRWFADNARKILDRYDGPTDIMVDLGAHVGLVSVLGTAGYNFTVAVAVEPDLENFVHMIDNIAIGDCEGKVLPVWAAVATESYTKTFLHSIPIKVVSEHLDGKGLNSGTHSLAYQEHYPTQSVLSLTLEDVVGPILRSKGKIDFLKVDIEGGEWKLLTKENKPIFSSVGYIDIELHPMVDEHLFKELGGTYTQARAYFKSLGFKPEKNQDTFGFFGHRS